MKVLNRVVLSKLLTSFPRLYVRSFTRVLISINIDGQLGWLRLSNKPRETRLQGEWSTGKSRPRCADVWCSRIGTCTTDLIWRTGMVRSWIGSSVPYLHSWLVEYMTNIVLLDACDIRLVADGWHKGRGDPAKVYSISIITPFSNYMV
jgi:hypothetical protein